MSNLTNKEALDYIYGKTTFRAYELYTATGLRLGYLNSPNRLESECHPKIKYFYDKVVFLDSLGISNITRAMYCNIKGRLSVLDLISNHIDFENDFFVVCKLIKYAKNEKSVKIHKSNLCQEIEIPF